MSLAHPRRISHRCVHPPRPACAMLWGMDTGSSSLPPRRRRLRTLLAALAAVAARPPWPCSRSPRSWRTWPAARRSPRSTRVAAASPASSWPLCRRAASTAPSCPRPRSRSPCTSSSCSARSRPPCRSRRTSTTGRSRRGSIPSRSTSSDGATTDHPARPRPLVEAAGGLRRPAGAGDARDRGHRLRQGARRAPPRVHRRAHPRRGPGGPRPVTNPVATYFTHRSAAEWNRFQPVLPLPLHFAARVELPAVEGDFSLPAIAFPVQARFSGGHGARATPRDEHRALLPDSTRGAIAGPPTGPWDAPTREVLASVPNGCSACSSARGRSRCRRRPRSTRSPCCASGCWRWPPPTRCGARCCPPSTT